MRDLTPISPVRQVIALAGLTRQQIANGTITLAQIDFRLERIIAILEPKTSIEKVEYVSSVKMDRVIWLSAALADAQDKGLNAPTDLPQLWEDWKDAVLARWKEETRLISSESEEATDGN